MKKRKVLTVFDDMIADTKANKKLSPIVTVLLIAFDCFTDFVFFFLEMIDSAL